MREAFFWLIVLTCIAAATAWMKPEWFPEQVQRWVAPDMVSAKDAERSAEQSRASAQARDEARAKENPPLYQWRDAQGQLQISDQPPKDRPYEIKRYDPNANVIPVLPGGQ